MYAYELWRHLPHLQAALEALEAGSLPSAEWRHLQRLVSSLVASAAALGWDEVRRAAVAIARGVDHPGRPGDDDGPPPAGSRGGLRRAFGALQRAAVGGAGGATLTELGETAPASAARRLLLTFVEDPALAAELSFHLGCFGFLVRVVSEPGALAPSLPHAAAVIVDAGAPGSAEALDAIQAARSEPRPAPAAAPPLLVLSPADDVESRLAAVRRGADAFLSRPPDLRELVERLDHLLQRRRSPPYRVLLVEPDRATRLDLCLALNGCGVEVTAVDDPLEVMQRLPEFSPEVVVTDLELAACSGDELAAVLRQDRRFADLPIVYLSRQTSLGQRLEAMRRGGDDLVVVPPVGETALQTVLHHAERHRTRRYFRCHDPLTGLLNFSSAMEALRDEARRARGQGDGLVVALLEVDGLGEVNRLHGYVAGDAVLRSLAHLLQHRFRRGDVLARFDSRFLVLLPDTPPAAAASVLDEVRMVFAEMSHKLGERALTATFSCGIASQGLSPTPGGEARDLHQAARRALGRAQLLGGNRVERAHD
jgi:diguanylate cyclase (GGDEF)-like protein